MHISVTCPRCDSRYQVEPNLRGRQMRCPNPVCRAIFEVRADGERGAETSGVDVAAPSRPRVSAESGKHVSGSVGDVVPIVQAEAAAVPQAPSEEARPEAASPVSDQDQAPRARAEYAPPLRRVPAAPVPRQEAPPAARVEPASARPAWENAPPPVRQVPVGASPAVAPAPPAESPDDQDFMSSEPEVLQEPAAAGPAASPPAGWEASPVGVGANASPARRGRRRAMWIILGLLLLLLGGLGSAFYLARGRLAETEADAFSKALELYRDSNFGEAAARLQALHRDFPDSKDRNRYLFLKELASVREGVYFSPDSPDKAAQAVGEFLRMNRADPLFKDYEGDLWSTLLKLARRLTELNEEKPDPRLIKLVRGALTEASQLKPPPRIDADQMVRDVEQKVADVENRLRIDSERRTELDRLRQLPPTAEAVQNMRREMSGSKFAKDPEFQALADKLLRDHVQSVKYVPMIKALNAEPPPGDQEPSFVLTPMLQMPVTPLPAVEGMVFALARGVLQALDPRKGEVRWTRRVGVDTHHLPLRIRATAAHGPVAVITSSDHNTVTAVAEETGTTIWEHQMPEPCLSGPVLAPFEPGSPGNRLLVPCRSGRVEELQLSDGRLLGYYELGQALPVGGVHQPGTTLVYFPGESFAVYVLDVARHSCVAILYSGHLRGSLHSRPVVIAEPGAGPEGRGLLLLTERETDDFAALRAFVLPISRPDQPPVVPVAKVRGGSWFQPYQDGERVALATDAGVFSLFDIQQKGNHDPVLFRQPEHDMRLDAGRPIRSGRSQVAAAAADDFWVLAHDRLQRLHLVFARQDGPKIVERWPQPLSLGSPLHAAQVLEDEAGEKILFLVTQSPDGESCLATAVEAQNGRIRWQRQLGVVVHGAPQAVGNDILIQDARRVFVFRGASAHDQPWQAAGEVLAAFEPPGRTFILSEKNVAYILNFNGTSLTVRRYQAGDDKPSDAKRYTLAHPLDGTPCLGDDCLIVPLKNGVLDRLPLDGVAPVHGPSWRDADVEGSSPCYVVSLGGGDFVYSDGDRGLRLLHWREPQLAQPRGKVEQLPRRIIAPPVVVGAAGGAGPRRLCVADAGDRLRLLDGDTLQVQRTWRMAGKITAGPFVRGSAVGCVVGKNHLVWIDAGKQQPLWEYDFPSEIAGEPHRVGDMVVIGTVAGQLLALDATSGRPLGAGYTLQANVAPTAAPLPFVGDRLFLPLTDGTVILPSEKLLR